MRIVELYKVVVAEQTYLWTSGDVAIDHLSETYLPEPIGRSEMAQQKDMNRQNITIRLPYDNPLAQLYFADVPDAVGSVTIFRFEKDEAEIEPSILTWWKGRIAGFRAEEHEVQFDCESVFTSMRRTGSRVRYQVQCNAALYDERCGVDKEEFAIAGTVTSINRLVVGVSLAETPEAGYLIGGMMRFGDSYRFVVNQGGSTVTLWREMPELEVGSVISVYPGCQRDLFTCKTRFNNTINYRGNPWLPNRTPFSFVNNF